MHLLASESVPWRAGVVKEFGFWSLGEENLLLVKRQQALDGEIEFGKDRQETASASLDASGIQTDGTSAENALPSPRASHNGDCQSPTLEKQVPSDEHPTAALLSSEGESSNLLDGRMGQESSGEELGSSSAAAKASDEGHIMLSGAALSRAGRHRGEPV